VRSENELFSFENFFSLKYSLASKVSLSTILIVYLSFLVTLFANLLLLR